MEVWWFGGRWTTNKSCNHFITWFVLVMVYSELFWNHLRSITGLSKWVIVPMLFQNSSYLSCHVLHVATTLLTYLLVVTVSVCRTVLVAQSCLTLCDPIDCSLPSFSVHGIPQARMLECIAIPFSREHPNPGIEPWSPALQADSLPFELQESPYTESWPSIKHS